MKYVSENDSTFCGWDSDYNGEVEFLFSTMPELNISMNQINNYYPSTVNISGDSSTFSMFFGLEYVNLKVYKNIRKDTELKDIQVTMNGIVYYMKNSILENISISIKEHIKSMVVNIRGNIYKEKDQKIAIVDNPTGNIR